MTSNVASENMLTITFNHQLQTRNVARGGTLPNHIFEDVNLWRTFYMDMSDVCDHMRPRQEFFFNKPAPNLEKLVLHNPYDRNAATTPYVFYSGIFLGQTPRLRIVKLENIYFDTDFVFSTWSGVTQLSVHQDLSGSEDGKRYAQKWLMALSNMRQLETLSLSWYISSSRYRLPLFEESMDISDVHLPRLRTLDLLSSIINDDPAINLHIFSRLSIPETCSTSIDYALVSDDQTGGICRELLWPKVGYHLNRWRSFPGPAPLLRTWSDRGNTADPSRDWESDEFGFLIKTTNELLQNAQLQVKFSTRLFKVDARGNEFERSTVNLRDTEEFWYSHARCVEAVSVDSLHVDFIVQ